jgi:hypothetical protein
MIKVNDFKEFCKTVKYSKRLFKSEHDILDFCWKEITKTENAMYMGKLSGEFNGDNYHECYRIGKMLFIKRPWGIEYASTGILRNSHVWKLKK